MPAPWSSSATRTCRRRRSSRRRSDHAGPRRVDRRTSSTLPSRPPRDGPSSPPTGLTSRAAGRRPNAFRNTGAPNALGALRRVGGHEQALRHGASPVVRRCETTLPLLEARRNQSCPAPRRHGTRVVHPHAASRAGPAGGGETWDFTDAGTNGARSIAATLAVLAGCGDDEGSGAAAARAGARRARTARRAARARWPAPRRRPASDDDHLVLVPGRRLPGERRSHPHRRAVEREEPKVCASRSGGSSMGRDPRASPTRDLGSTRGSDRRSQRAAAG